MASWNKKICDTVSSQVMKRRTCSKNACYIIRWRIIKLKRATHFAGDKTSGRETAICREVCVSAPGLNLLISIPSWNPAAPDTFHAFWQHCTIQISYPSTDKVRSPTKTCWSDPKLTSPRGVLWRCRVRFPTRTLAIFINICRCFPHIL